MSRKVYKTRSFLFKSKKMLQFANVTYVGDFLKIIRKIESNKIRFFKYTIKLFM